MEAKWVTPILNVSNLANSFEWFGRLGWTKNWEWGEPPGFGCVTSGDINIFMCQDGQGGRGKGSNTQTFGPGNEEAQDKGVWMSLWVDQVDDVYATCLSNDIEVTFKPEDMPWGVREMHVRHPDGHVFRIGQTINSPT